MIDTHCHLNHEDYLSDIEKYINEAKEHNVNNFLVIGWDLESSKLAVEIANKYECCYAAVGIHPCDTLVMKDNDLSEIENLIINNKKVICVGEVGLDFYWNKEEKDKESQRKWFNYQIDLANKYNLPICVHSRDANEETYKILKNNTPKHGGVMHCYAGGAGMLDNYLKLGMYFGFNGVITFKNSIAPKESVIKCPIDRLFLETDCPYLTPTPHRGEMNKPEYTHFVLEEVSRLKNISETEVDNITTQNFKKLFNL